MSSRLQRDGALEKEDRIYEMKKNKTKKKKQTTRPAPQQAPALPYAKVVERPGTGSYPAPWPDPTTHEYALVTCKYKKDRIISNREKVETPFPHYKSMGAFCCHGHQSFDPICLKT